MGYLKGIMIMPRPKKTTTTKNIVKTEAAVKAAEKETVAAKAEVKPEKPVEVKAPKAAEVKAAPADSPKAAKKPAAKKAAPAAKKAVAEKTKPAARKGGRKPKPVTVDYIVAKIYKRIDKAAAKKIAAEGKAAVDIKLYGTFEAHMYIEVKNGNVSVAPYDYIEKDIEAAVSVENALAIADGKLSVKEAVENGALYVFGNVQFALKFAELFD